MNIIFVCGGTAGHINPALAIAAEFRRIIPKAKILFIGAGKDLEKRLIPQAGFHLVNIKMSGLRRGFTPRDILYNFKTMKNLAAAGFKAKKLLRRFAPDAVIGTGGYICYPVLKRASRMGIPTVVHESNAVPGLTTKLLSASVDRVLVSFPGLEGLYRHPGNVSFTGTPVRGGFKPGFDAGRKPFANGKPLVVSFWGSLGAEFMNEIIAEFIKLNIDAALFAHIHAAGKTGGVYTIKARLKQLGAPDELPPDVEIREYIDDMQAVMAAADIVICRAGGSTIAELTAMGKPAVLIPSPYVTNNQQVENARQVQKAGGAVTIQENDCDGRIIFDTVSAILQDAEKLGRMSEAQKALGAPDAAERITGIITDLCSRR